MKEAYELREVTDEQAWEAFDAALKPHTFLQSWKWGQQYAQSGARIFRVGAYAGGRLAGIALFIKIEARRGSFLLCPHGPLGAETEDEADLLAGFAAEATRLARQERCDFIRWCPLLTDSPDRRGLFKKLGFRDAPIHMHPELSWMLSLEKPEEELLMEMRKTTRYLIKKTEKDGVTIAMSANPDDIARFWPVYQETVQRQQFTPFSKEYLRQEFELFAADNQAAFFFGTYEGETIAAAIIIFYADSAFYHHSGSIHKFDKINASYPLQWHVIQEAKRRGCKLYNFWGIAPEDKPNHPWAGLSLFKKGFGGFPEAYVHAQDKPITPKYWLNFAVETMRRKKRGY